jgi:hypothetical protein
MEKTKNIQELWTEISELRKSRNISNELLTKHCRIRQIKLAEIEDQISKGVEISIPDMRIINNLAQYFKLETLKIDSKKDALVLKKKNSSPIKKPTFFLATYRNLANFSIFVVVTVVLFLVGLPAYLVLRPAEVIWEKESRNNLLEIDPTNPKITGTAPRAKQMIFGGKNIKLNDGRFELMLQKPEKPAFVTLELTNYFEFKTEILVVLY